MRGSKKNVQFFSNLDLNSQKLWEKPGHLEISKPSYRSFQMVSLTLSILLIFYNSYRLDCKPNGNKMIGIELYFDEFIF